MQSSGIKGGKPSGQPQKPATTSGKMAKPTPTAWRDRIEPEDFQLLKETFEVFDEDGSGTIDPEEIMKILVQLGLDQQNQIVRHIIEAIKDKNKEINFEEFLDIVCSIVGETKTRDGLRRIFNIYDRNGDGQIDFDELKAVAHMVQDRFNDEEVLEMMHSTFINCKTSSNESFTFEEFYAIVTKIAH